MSALSEKNRTKLATKSSRPGQPSYHCLHGVLLVVADCVLVVVVHLGEVHGLAGHVQGVQVLHDMR